MSKPDHVSSNYHIVSFWDKEFRGAMVRLLNWLDEPYHKEFTRADGTKGMLEHTKDFYAFHDTMTVSQFEDGDYCVQICVSAEVLE